MNASDQPDFTDDAFLGGRVLVRQPTSGYRAAMDTVLLAAAIPATQKGRILELGCGAGTASLCAAWRLMECMVVGVDIDPEMIDLARDNANRNGLQDRVHFETAAIKAGGVPEALLGLDTVDYVIANPPYLAAGSGDVPPNPGKGRAMVEADAKLTDWIDTMLTMLRPKGGLTMVHRADRIHEIVAGLHGRAGEITIFPLWPRRGSAAKRIIVQARKGVRGGSTIAAGLVLHGDTAAERYTAEAEKILREGEGLRLR